LNSQSVVIDLSQKTLSSVKQQQPHSGDVMSKHAIGSIENIQAPAAGGAHGDGEEIGYNITHDLNEIPEDLDRIFACPIGYMTMTEPVYTSDGFCYEKSVIAEWFKNNDTSPLAGILLVDKTLTTNYELLDLMEESRNGGNLDHYLSSIRTYNARSFEEINKSITDMKIRHSIELTAERHSVATQRRQQENRTKAAITILGRQRYNNTSKHISQMVTDYNVLNVNSTHSTSTNVILFAVHKMRTMLYYYAMTLNKYVFNDDGTAAKDIIISMSFAVAMFLCGKIMATNKTLLRQMLSGGQSEGNKSIIPQKIYKLSNLMPSKIQNNKR
jgi:hypothetical protein